MRRSFKIAFLILLIATIVWTLACYQHVSAYNQMITDAKQRVGEEFFNRFYDIAPVWAVWNGPLLFIIGFFMIFAWIGFLSELYRLRKRV